MRERLRQFFADRPISEWVARLLDELGHEVVVADPNYAPMYAQRSRRVKTDKRDARALAEACRLGAYRPAHRTSEEQRHVRALLGVRESLVRARVRFVALVQAVLSREGLRVSTGTMVALARKLSGILYAMWRDGSAYDPAKLGGAQGTSATKAA
jgi:transposase